MPEPEDPRDEPLADMKAFRVHIGRRLKDARIFRGVTLESLAEAIGVIPEQLRAYEAGTRSLSLSLLWRISRVLTLPAASFFEGLPGDDGNVFHEGEDVPPPLSDRALSIARLVDHLGEERIGTRLHQLLSHLAAARSAKGCS